MPPRPKSVRNFGRERPLPKITEGRPAVGLEGSLTPSLSQSQSGRRRTVLLRKRIAPAAAGCQVSPRICVQESKATASHRKVIDATLIVAAQHPPGVATEGTSERPQCSPDNRLPNHRVQLQPRVDRTFALQWRDTTCREMRTITSSMMGSLSSRSRISASLRPRHRRGCDLDGILDPAWKPALT